MAGDDTTPDPSFKNDRRRPRKEEPAHHPGGSVSNVSPPAASSAASNKRRPWSSIGKLMGGAMETNNSGESALSIGASSKVKKKKKAATDFFPNKAHVTDRLRAILADLDASDPTLVFEKHMPLSDRSKGQNRLLMSCKCQRRRASFARILTDTERPLVHPPEPVKKTEDDKGKCKGKKKDKHGGKGKGKKKDGGEDNNGKHKTNDGGKDVGGLDVQAYDCDGRAYELTLKYLWCNTAYRIIGPAYSVFLENNGLLVQKKRRNSLPDDEDEQPAVRDDDDDDDIQMELWAFRTPKLSIGEKDQPDGALGLLLLHYHRGRGGGGEEPAQDQEMVVVVEQPQQQISHGMAAAVAAQQDEDIMGAHVVGDCTVGDAAATVVDDEDGEAGKLGDAAARPSRDMHMPLSPAERLIARWLSFHRNDDTDGAC